MERYICKKKLQWKRAVHHFKKEILDIKFTLKKNVPNKQMAYDHLGGVQWHSTISYLFMDMFGVSKDANNISH